MIHYVVVTGRPAAVDRLVPQLSRALAATSTFTGEQAHHVAADHTWAAAGVSMADPTCGPRLVADEQSMVVFNGPAISATGDQRDLGGSVLRAFRAEGPTGVAGVLGGAYNLVGASPDHGVRGLVDFSGLAPLYWHEGSDAVIFSNRSSTVANLAGTSGWDLRALGWLIGHSNLIDAHVPAPGVDYLVPGCEARVPTGEPRVEVVRGPTWVWADPSEDAGRHNLSADTWDEITGELIETFRSFASFGEPIRLGLTGGKDSRLCLALIKAAGLEDNVQVSTNGGDDSPEVEVALAVAERAGVPHRRAGPPAGGPTRSAPSPPTPERMWRRLRQHAYRYESMICPWDGTNDPLSRVVVGMKGFGGELYRSPFGTAKRKRELPPSLDAMAEALASFWQRHDPLDVLPRSERDHQRQRLREWVHEASAAVRFDLIPRKFYVDHRLGHWNGPMDQAKAGVIDLNPLLSRAVASRVFELSADTRRQERFHYEVMRRAAPELLTVPFLRDGWSKHLVAEVDDPLPTEPYPTTVTPTPRALSSWQWHFFETEGRAMRALFEDAARRTSMGAIADVGKLKKVARRADRIDSFVHGKALLSAVGVALSLLGRSEPVTDTA